jgi:EAL domain-containing protein (putative c-di-GMP-specific phosphodiesterase class I)
MARVGTPLGPVPRRVPGLGMVEAVGTMLVLTPVAAWLVTNESAHQWVLAFGALLVVGEGTALAWMMRCRREAIASQTPPDQRARRLRRDLPGAFLRNELEMFYQPICRAHDGSLVGAEALARWRHPRLGTLSAGEFVPLVEADGWDDELDDWALRSVLRDGKVVCDAVDGMDAYVTVNISPHQLERPGFVERVTDLLASGGGRADGLVIELTETSAVTDWPQLTANIDALQRLGFALAVDDFGAGHANLLHLSRLDPDIVKLDRDLVVAAVSSGRGLNLVQSSVSMAKSLGVLVVAEGVEDSAWAPELARLGVDYVQGYAVGMPRPAAEFGL